MRNLCDNSHKIKNKTDVEGKSVFENSVAI